MRSGIAILIISSAAFSNFFELGSEASSHGGSANGHGTTQMSTYTNLHTIPGLVIPDGERIMTDEELLAVNVDNSRVLPITQHGEFVILRRITDDPKQPGVIQYATEKLLKIDWVIAISDYAKSTPGCLWMLQSSRDYVESFRQARTLYLMKQPSREEPVANTPRLQVGQSSRPKSRSFIDTGNQGEVVRNQIATLSLDSPRSSRRTPLASPRGSRRIPPSPRLRSQISSLPPLPPKVKNRSTPYVSYSQNQRQQPGE